MFAVDYLFHLKTKSRSSSSSALTTDFKQKFSNWNKRLLCQETRIVANMLQII
jgi:hypothetical protein